MPRTHHLQDNERPYTTGCNTGEQPQRDGGRETLIPSYHQQTHNGPEANLHAQQYSGQSPAGERPMSRRTADDGRVNRSVPVKTEKPFHGGHVRIMHGDVMKTFHGPNTTRSSEPDASSGGSDPWFSEQDGKSFLFEKDEVRSHNSERLSVGMIQTPALNMLPGDRMMGGRFDNMDVRRGNHRGHLDRQYPEPAVSPPAQYPRYSTEGDVSLVARTNETAEGSKEADVQQKFRDDHSDSFSNQDWGMDRAVPIPRFGDSSSHRRPSQASMNQSQPSDWDASRSHRRHLYSTTVPDGPPREIPVMKDNFASQFPETAPRTPNAKWRGVSSTSSTESDLTGFTSTFPNRTTQQDDFDFGFDADGFDFNVQDDANDFDAQNSFGGDDHDGFGANDAHRTHFDYRRGQGPQVLQRQELTGRSLASPVRSDSSPVASTPTQFDNARYMHPGSFDKPTATPTTTTSLQESFPEDSKVRFGEVRIREYERIMGDNPSCVNGPSIGIGWRYGVEHKTSVHQHQQAVRERWARRRRPPRHPGASASKPKPTGVHECLLGREERELMLLGLGYSRRDIAAAVRAKIQIKNRRRQTVQNLEMDDLIESAGNGIKTMLFLSKRK